MIDLHYWPTPNGWKISICLEEMALAYRVVPVDIGRGDQFAPAFLQISPNNRMPAIVDADGPDGKPISVFESGAILLYLAEKTGRFLPRDARGRVDVFQWLMFQMGGVGPMFGQANHFHSYAPEKVPYAIDRYAKETRRLCGVLDRRLADGDYLAGEYSIADMATFPWVHALDRVVGLEGVPALASWVGRLRERPAVARGLDVMAKEERRGQTVAELSKEPWSTLFGDRQFERR